MSSLDISFCLSNCANKKCERHMSRLEGNKINVSWADFSDNCTEFKKSKKKSMEGEEECEK